MRDENGLGRRVDYRELLGLVTAVYLRRGIPLKDVTLAGLRSTAEELGIDGSAYKSIRVEAAGSGRGS